jgi:hypothetical protein
MNFKMFAQFHPFLDPKLPRKLYGRVLQRMLEEIDELKVSADSRDDSERELTLKAEDCFLNTLTGWGPTNFLKEHIKLCKYQASDQGAGAELAIKDAEARFARRFTQTSAGYLNFPVPNEQDGEQPSIRSEGYYDTRKALFDVDDLLKSVASRTSIINGCNSDTDSKTIKEGHNSRAALDALAKLNMMKGQYDVALQCYLAIGALHSGRPFSSFESGAVEVSSPVGAREIDKPWQNENGVSYTHVLEIIDSHHLQQCLLDHQFLSILGTEKRLPLFSLMQLVGLRRIGDFLIEHCVPPQSSQSRTREHSVEQGGERRGTLPLDLVAGQLAASPNIMHWYLHLVFTRKPEVYVKFPNTAYPPKAVTDLHRMHFDRYIEFSGSERDSSQVLSGIEAYKASSIATPLLLFLKVCRNALL